MQTPVLSVRGQCWLSMTMNNLSVSTVTKRVKGIGETKSCQTVSAVVTYDHPVMGDTYMLVFHQAIMVPNLNSNLLCPNQMRANDLRVNDEPKHCIDQPTQDHHAIVVPDVDSTGEGLSIPLSMIG